MRYSDDIKEKAIEYYLVGYSAQKIADMLGPNEATVRCWLKERNIPLRDAKVYNTKYSPEFVASLWELYKSGLDTIQITEKLHLKRGIVSSLLRKNGYVLNHRGPKSKIGNENYFDRIDTDDKAYFLGWLMADGNLSITDGQYSIKIHIAYRDKEIIDKFLVYIQSTNKTKIKEQKLNNFKDKEHAYKSYYVSLTSKHMCESLMNYGVMPHKTGKEIMPSNIPQGFIHDFIRGVFDGDGITDIKKLRSGFVGSYSLVNSIRLKIKEPEIKIYPTKSDGIYYFLGGRAFSRKLFDYMYKDSSLYLKRKYDRLKYICGN